MCAIQTGGLARECAVWEVQDGSRCTMMDMEEDEKQRNQEEAVDGMSQEDAEELMALIRRYGGGGSTSGGVEDGILSTEEEEEVGVDDDISLQNLSGEQRGQSSVTFKLDDENVEGDAQTSTIDVESSDTTGVTTSAGPPPPASSSSPVRAPTVSMREFSFASSSIDKAMSHFQRSKEEDDLVAAISAAAISEKNAAAAKKKKPLKSPIKSTAKFTVRKPRDLLLHSKSIAGVGRGASRPGSAPSSATNKKPLTAATRYGGGGSASSTARPHSSGPRPAVAAAGTSLSSSNDFGSQSGAALRRFAKKKMPFAEAYAEEIAAIIEGDKDDALPSSTRAAATASTAVAEPTRVSLEYVSDLEEQLQRLKRSIDGTDADDDMPSSSSTPVRASAASETRTSLVAAKDVGSMGTVPRDNVHDNGDDDNVVLLAEDIVDDEVRQLLAACSDTGNRPRSSRFSVVSTAGADDTNAPADTASLLDLMSRYRDTASAGTGHGPGMRDDSFLQRKRDEFAEDLAFVDERLSATEASEKDTESDVWAAMHSDDESVYRGLSGVSGAQADDVIVDLNYFSDSELANNADICVDAGMSDPDVRKELQGLFERRREEAALRAMHQREAEQRAEKLRKRRERSLAKSKKKADAENSRNGYELYDPHDNCVRFLGPRSMHGDGLPHPSEDGGGCLHRRHHVHAPNVTKKKKKSIMQCKLEADLELKRQEEEQILKHKFVANPIPKTTYELRYTRYLTEAADLRRKRVTLRREMMTRMSSSFSRQAAHTKARPASATAASGGAGGAQKKASSSTTRSTTARATSPSKETDENAARGGFKAREVPSSFRDNNKLERMRADADARKLLAKEEAKRKLESASLPPRMAFHERERRSQQQQEHGNVIVKVVSTGKRSTTDAQPQRRLGEVPNFGRLQREFEEKLRKSRSSNRSRLTVPQEFTLNGRDKETQQRRRMKADERRGKILQQIEQDALKMRETRWPYLARREDTDAKRAAAAKAAAASSSAPVSYHETRSSQCRKERILERIRCGAYDEREVREEKDARRRYEEYHDRATAWMKAQTMKDKGSGVAIGGDEASSSTAATHPSGDGSERGQAMHIAARHKQIEEGVRSLVECTLLENDVYKEHRALARTSMDMEAGDDDDAGAGAYDTATRGSSLGAVLPPSTTTFTSSPARVVGHDTARAVVSDDEDEFRRIKSTNAVLGGDGASVQSTTMRAGGDGGESFVVTTADIARDTSSTIPATVAPPPIDGSHNKDAASVAATSDAKLAEVERIVSSSSAFQYPSSSSTT